MTIQKTIADLSPSFFRGPVAGRVFESIAAVADMMIETQVLGLQQGDPLRCDSSALPFLGRDRGIRRYPTESEDSYRRRLAGWRETKKHWGSLIGQMRQLQLWFSPQAPMIRAVHMPSVPSLAVWHTLDSAGNYTVHRQFPSNWDWDSVKYDPGLGGWSRYWVIVYTNELDPSSLIDSIYWDGGGTYNSHAVWDGLFTAAQIADMVSVLKDWKAAHSQLAGLIFAHDGASFNPTAPIANLGDGTTTHPNGKWYLPTDPNTGLPTRLATASYAYLDQTEV